MDLVILVQLVLGVLATLVGFPALLSLVLTTLEFYGKIDQAGVDKINFWSQVAVFGAIFVAAISGHLDLVTQIDLALGQFAKVLLEVLILLGVPVGFAISRSVHSEVSKARFLGLR